MIECQKNEMTQSIKHRWNSYICICMQNSDILSVISIMNVITEKSCFIYLPCSYLSRNATKLETIQARWAEFRTPSCFMSASQKYINSSTPMNLEKLSVHFRWISVFQIFSFKNWKFRIIRRGIVTVVLW